MIKNLENVEAWAKQISYWRTHLDIAIEQMFGVRLTEEQAVAARSIGNSSEAGLYSSRGFGKSFLAALIVSSICVLYPESHVICLSNTIAQGTIVLQKIAEIASTHEGLMRELLPVSNKSIIAYSKTSGGKCKFKNGSLIESMAVDSSRGQRATMVIVDELLELNKPTIDSIVSPLLNYRRPIAVRVGFEPERTKLLLLSSGFPQSHSCYEYVSTMMNQMKKGNRESFVCAIPYQAAIRGGLTDESFFEQEKRRLSSDDFAMEYKCWFVAGNSGGVYPYQDIEKIRVLRDIELKQTKNTTSGYLIGTDLASSTAKTSDNTVISVCKYTQLPDYTYLIQLVYMRSYNGKPLDYIATELRKLYHINFPGAKKICYDHKGLGVNFSRYFANPWTYNGIEYPPLIDDTAGGGNAVLHPVDADNKYNVNLVSNFKMLIEQERLQLPVSSRIIREIEAENALKTFEDKNDSESTEKTRKLTMEERAVFFEADSLQHEFGNIVEMRTQAGNVIYDTTSIVKKKDRYSSLGLCINYLMGEEERNVKFGISSDNACLGVIDSIYGNDGWGSIDY